jgi:osmoprotectant transport system substrate-binding protein
VVRLDALDRFPQLRTQLLALARTLDEKTMRQLNARVEIDHVSPAQVAREYWTNHQSR